MHLDRRRLVACAAAGSVSKLACTDAAAFDRDLLAQRRADAVERRALHLVLGAARVDDLAADVADDPDLVDLDVAGRRDRRLHHFGEVAEWLK